MHVRILDFDKSVVAQERLIASCHPEVFDFRAWGPCLRLGCSFRRFAAFERVIDTCLIPPSQGAALTFVGSGDFHHVTLALLRQLKKPFVLLVLDNHPDWMRGIPLMHCGTWLHHALRLDNLERVIHLGGNVDFDNAFRWLAPWRALHDGRIVVAPAVRNFRGRPWCGIPHSPLLDKATGRLTEESLERLVETVGPSLAGRDVYVSLDKDVLRTMDAVVNWDSGALRLTETIEILGRLFDATGARLAGMDVVGDWSRVKVSGTLRRLLHWTEHPALDIDAHYAQRLNEEINLCLVDFVEGLDRSATSPTGAPHLQSTNRDLASKRR